MTEERKIVLMSSLGKSPGVVTAAIDALEMELRRGVDELVTLSTKEIVTVDRRGRAVPGDCINILNSELREYYQDRIKLDARYIEYKEIDDQEACLEFLGLACQQIRNYRQAGHEVYISLAGGRKSMSGIMAIATQFFGAEALFHVAVTDEKEDRTINEHGDDLQYIKGFPVNSEQRNLILHPSSARMVRLPFLDMSLDMNEVVEAIQQSRELNEETQRMLEKAGIQVQKKVVSAELKFEYDIRGHGIDLGKLWSQSSGRRIIQQG